MDYEERLAEIKKVITELKTLTDYKKDRDYIVGIVEGLEVALEILTKE